ncbi:type II toxin-antitoxin system PemK/MazF family toxin [Streptomyces zingiberis]|uniref:Type II toxin-antitoxin system PemK/MazF family toxin n=1 Tax=Streptomyces zingiberis TaxID=2053010 RepID=A0ABX1C4H5_9ACTN|nr:type II toxin-antitoxin system PemK/MazF family toxin [Streptomyces zingiberis]NJQ01819.1 type II toxin-antitoxin system PemK/MazF family toxin [Streptomyces zingiberis]
MNTWVWVAVAVVVVLALVASAADGWGRGAPPRRRRRPGGRTGARPGERVRRPGGGRGPAGRPPRTGPRPGARAGGGTGVRAPGRARERVTEELPAPRAREIWWAEVPFEDGPGSKDRPCLVLSVRGRSARVVKITSRDGVERPGRLELPAGSVGDRQERRSYLETDELREVPLAEFRRRVGEVDPAVWRQVRRLTR